MCLQTLKIADVQEGDGFRQVLHSPTPLIDIHAYELYYTIQAEIVVTNAAQVQVPPKLSTGTDGVSNTYEQRLESAIAGASMLPFDISINITALHDKLPPSWSNYCRKAWKSHPKLLSRKYRGRQEKFQGDQHDDPSAKFIWKGL